MMIKLRIILLIKWVLKIQPPFLGRHLLFKDVIAPPKYMIAVENIKKQGYEPMKRI